MRTFMLVFLSVTLMASVALYAADAQKGNKSEKLTVSGIVVDNHCANAHKSDLDKFTKSHPKECTLMPDCAASGYSLYHHGALLRFNKESSKKVEQFLKNKDSKTEVTVVVSKSGEEYNLISIKNK